MPNRLLMQLKSRGTFNPTLLNQTSTKQIDTSTKQLDTLTDQYNMKNWKATTKLICVQININKILVRMISRVNKRLRSHPKRKKSRGIVMFISMNAVNNYSLQPFNARV